MEAKPKISSRLILIVIIIFVLLAFGIYFLISSEELTKFAIETAIKKYFYAENLSIKLDNLRGNLLQGIKINRINIKHRKPNLDVIINNFSLDLLYEQLLNKGLIELTSNIESLDYYGSLKISPNIASIPPFIGYECFAALPSNIKINRIDVNNIRIIPFDDKNLEIHSDSINFKSTDKANLDVVTTFSAKWKDKLLAKSSFKGILEPRKDKINGRIDIDLAKQFVSSELSLGFGKKGIEISGYIASDTQIDFMPLSQWLGYLWQLEYPYSINGKIHCNGSWFYNQDIGFLGNLNGKYEKIEISFMGLFLCFLELNGDWKYFDGNLNLTDTGSKLFGFPAKLDGKIDSLNSPSNSKYNISFISNSIPLYELTSSLPWMLKYSKGIPELDGIATLSASLSGNKPIFSTEINLDDLSLHSKGKNATKIKGNIIYDINETNNSMIKADFLANTETGLPEFFRHFSKRFYETENKKNSSSLYKYSINGNFNDSVKLNGLLSFENGNKYETTGELVDEKFNIKLIINENRIYNIINADPIDLLLMR